MYVRIGNASAIEGYRDPNSDDPGKLRFREVPGEHITEFSFPDGIGLQEAVRGVVASLDHQMAKGERPAWIESDVEAVETVLLDQFNIPRRQNRRPRTWGEQVAKASAGGGGIAPLVMMPLLVIEAWMLFAASRLNVRTLDGRDWMARIMGDPNSTATGIYGSGSWLGVTANAVAPVNTDAVLSGEITAGTLARRQAIYSHTNGTAPYTLTSTFTSDQSVTLNKLGVFIGAGAVAMVFSSLLNAPATLVAGDQTQVTETVTLN